MTAKPTVEEGIGFPSLRREGMPIPLGQFGQLTSLPTSGAWLAADAVGAAARVPPAAPPIAASTPSAVATRRAGRNDVRRMRRGSLDDGLGRGADDPSAARL